ncbi:MAG TPA: serine hydrolase domain-containing protein [Vicinamibacterales bacterium]|jgi:CubicO group peptidase (beta-lactamase class C family)|nr:serine hydrolase domain-containing protein [Vicinamibacterales bacterium]
MSADRPAGIAAARELVSRAIGQRVFPAATVDVGTSRRSFWREAFGRLTFDESAPGTSDETIFDLASLTKPLATTTIVLRLASSNAIDLNSRVADAFSEWRGDDRAEVSIRDLLEHASGLPARLIDRSPQSRREFEHDICQSPLEYQPRSKSIYSDLGFILLGFVAEDRGDDGLGRQFEQLVHQLADVDRWTDAPFIGFDVAPERRTNAAPTLPLDEDVRRGEPLAGRVHDNYAAALGGAAGHAGLFGTSAGVAAFARAILRVAREEAKYFPPFTYPWVMKAIRKSSVPGSSRALGWDTMLPTSSCGSAMSFAAFGHVGYTGTSLWIDPILDRYFVLLTNRAYGGGSLDQMRDVRRGFHDAFAGIDFDE